jgi:hypothetical protein
MLTSRLHSIPRFALPYTAGDFTTSLVAMFRRLPPPDAFQLLGDSPKFWTRSGRQALRLLLTAVYGSLAGRRHCRRGPPAGLH